MDCYNLKKKRNIKPYNDAAAAAAEMTTVTIKKWICNGQKLYSARFLRQAKFRFDLAKQKFPSRKQLLMTIYSNYQINPKITSKSVFIFSAIQLISHYLSLLSSFCFPFHKDKRIKEVSSDKNSFNKSQMFNNSKCKRHTIKTCFVVGIVMSIKT